MTENEQKAIRWIENVRSNAIVTLDHIENKEPNVNPLVYAGRKEKAETILKMIEELKQYRAIGTVDRCRAAVEKQTATKPHIWGDGHDDEGNIIYDMYDCPNCGKSYEIDYDNYKYCPECGQCMDRSDNNEK